MTATSNAPRSADPTRTARLGLSALGITPEVLRVGAAAAVIALTVRSTGSVLVPAILLGVAVGSRLACVSLVAALSAVLVRFPVDSLDEYAAVQSVLGPAGVVGPPTGAASAWCAAAAIVLAAAASDRSRLQAAVVALAAGSLAATVVVGVGTDGPIVVRVLATVGFAGLVLVAGTTSGRVSRALPALGLVVGLVALGLSAWPS